MGAPYSHEQATIDSGGLDHEVEARFYNANSDYLGLIARYQDKTNYILLQRNINGVLYLYTFIAGTYFHIWSGGFMPEGSLLKLRVVGNTATIFMDKVQTVQINIAIIPTGTRAGLNSYVPGSGRFDNIRISSPPLATSPVNMPFVITEISTSLPSDPPAWVEIPNRLRSAAVKRGKARWFDKVNAGTCVATFSNADRGLDPEHVGNLLGANLMPGKRFRIRGIYNAVTYPVFDGYIDTIRQEAKGPNDSVAIFTVIDGLGKLNSYSLDSTFAVALASFPVPPKAWLRLGEDSNVDITPDRTGTNNNGYYIGVHNPVDGLVYLDADKATSFPAGNGNYLFFNGNLLSGNPSWTISFHLDIAQPAVVQYLFQTFSGSRGLQIFVTNDGKLTAETLLDGGAISSYARTASFVTGVPQLITIVAEAGQKLKIYSGPSDATDNTSSSGTVHILSNDPISCAGNANSVTVLDEILVFHAALTLAQVLALENARSGWNGDTVVSRANRILNSAKWPLADRSIDESIDGALASTGLGVSALTHLREIESSMEGRLFVSANGTLILLSRSNWIANYRTAILATFGDGAGELPYVGLGTYELTYSTVVNRVNRVNAGLVYPAVDSNSVNAYGPRNEDVESIYQSNDKEQALANYRLAYLKTPLAHVESLAMLPGASPAALYPVALGCELGKRIAVIRRPQLVGAPINMAVIVEGIQHDFNAEKWATRFSIDAIGAQAVADIA